MNLISVTQLMSQPWIKVKFRLDLCRLELIKDGKIISIGHSIKGLFMITKDMKDINTNSSEKAGGVMTNDNGATQLWHLRLGHTSFQQMRKLYGTIGGLLKTTNAFQGHGDAIPCDDCLVDKMTRTPFKGKIEGTKQPLDRGLSRSGVEAGIYFGRGVHIFVWVDDILIMEDC